MVRINLFVLALLAQFTGWACQEVSPGLALLTIIASAGTIMFLPMMEKEDW